MGPGAFVIATMGIVSASQGDDRITGEWIGVMHRYPALVGVHLSVSVTTNGGLQGRLVYADFQTGEPTGDPAVLRATYDDVAQWVSLDAPNRPPASRSQRRRRTVPSRTEPFELAFVEEQQQLAGLVPMRRGDSSPYVVFVRPKAVNRTFKSLQKALAAQNRPTGGAGGPLRRGQIRGWAQVVVDDIATLDARNTDSGQLADITRNLFADEHFGAAFGKRYDDLGAGARAGLRARMRRIGRSATEPVDVVAGTTERGFMSQRGTFNALDMTMSVLGMRTLSAWQHEALTSLEQAAPTEVIGQAKALRRAAERLFRFRLPSDQARFERAILDIQERQSGPALAAAVDRLIEAATEAPGVVSLEAAIRRASSDRSASEVVRLAGLVSAERWQVAQARLTEARNERMPMLIEALENDLPVATDHVEEVARAVDDLRRRYAGVMHLDAVSTRDRQAVGIWEKALARDEARIRQRMEEATTPPSVDAVVASVLMDEPSEVADRIRGAATDRKQAIAFAVAEARRRRDLGPFDGPGAAYLNAVYRGDQARIRELDLDFAEPYRKWGEGVSDGGYADLMALLSMGTLKAENLKSGFRALGDAIGLSLPVMSTFVLNYEHLYPECMADEPVRFKVTTITELVRKNIHGTEVSRTFAGERIEHFNVQPRHARYFEAMSRDLSGPIMVDALFGKRGATTVADVLESTRRGMRTHACDSEVMQQFERNLTRTFDEFLAKMARIDRTLLGGP